MPHGENLWTWLYALLFVLCTIIAGLATAQEQRIMGTTFGCVAVIFLVLFCGAIWFGK